MLKMMEQKVLDDKAFEEKVAKDKRERNEQQASKYKPGAYPTTFEFTTSYVQRQRFQNRRKYFPFSKRPWLLKVL
jgi:hypothetical protein